MLDAADLGRRRVVAEFGPGTGVFTFEIIRRMRPDARLLVFEIDPEFAETLRRRIDDPRVVVLHASAEHLGWHLDEIGEAHVDCVISGLPFTSLPRQTTEAILRATRASLAPDGVFVAYQYTPALLRLLRSYFPTVRIANFVLANLPPALVLVCGVS